MLNPSDDVWKSSQQSVMINSFVPQRASGFMQDAFIRSHTDGGSTDDIEIKPDSFEKDLKGQDVLGSMKR